MTLEEKSVVYVSGYTMLLRSCIADGWSETNRRLVPMAFGTFHLLLILGTVH